MDNITSVLEAQQSLEAALFQRMAVFDSQLKAATSAPQNTVTTSILQEDFAAFKTSVCSIINLLRQQISECCKSLDNIEMRHRRKYLLINGISEDIQESLPTHIAKLFEEKLGLKEVVPDKFRVCHRLGNNIEAKCRPVLVRFTDLSLKSLVWRKKVGFKGTGYVVSEFLTHKRQCLFIQARRQLGIKNCWTLDGNIIVKLNNGTRRRIATEEELSGLSGLGNLPAEEEVEKGPSHSSAGRSASKDYIPKKRRAAKRYK